jgi:predicted 3-demethylubiquinone-9 3-methyltransferase (glyoxalase superfamily)
MTEALISISLPTDNGICLYSAKIVESAHFYVHTIQESEFDVVLQLSEEESVPIKSSLIFEHMVIEDNLDKIACFRTLYGKEFHTCSFNIFKLLEDGFQTKYGRKIEQGPIYQKNSQLLNKIISVERQIETILSTLNVNSRKKLEERGLKSVGKECRKLLVDPISNEKEINDKMDACLLSYRNLVIEQKEDIDRLETKLKKEKEDKEKEKMTIVKNRFGQFVHQKYNMVFDPKTMEFIGICNGMGGMDTLTYPLIQLCRSKGWRFRSA